MSNLAISLTHFKNAVSSVPVTGTQLLWARVPAISLYGHDIVTSMSYDVITKRNALVSFEALLKQTRDVICGTR